MSDLSKNTSVHLVFVRPTDKKMGWLAGTDRRQDPKTKVFVLWPLIDDDPRQSTPMAYEFAVVAQRRFREELGIVFRLALEASPGAPFVDEEIIPPQQHSWEHKDYLVTVDAAGKPVDDLDSAFVYSVKAVHTVQLGPAFVWKSNDGRLVNQPQFSSFDEGPEACIWKAFERGFTKIEKPQPNPHLAAREAERQRIAEENARPKFKGRRRPGDI